MTKYVHCVLDTDLLVLLQFCSETSVEFSRESVLYLCVELHIAP
jgi:hypothetical protein